MVTIPKTIGVISFACLLCGSVSSAYAAQSHIEASLSEDRGAQANQHLVKEGGSDPIVVQEDQTGQSQSSEIIKGEVLRVEGELLFVKGADGKEVRMHVDETTIRSDKKLEQGDLIEVTVNELNHALSILSSDRRNH
jgi:hypothetical protein